MEDEFSLFFTSKSSLLNSRTNEPRNPLPAGPPAECVRICKLPKTCTLHPHLPCPNQKAGAQATLTTFHYLPANWKVDS